MKEFLKYLFCIVGAIIGFCVPFFVYYCAVGNLNTSPELAWAAIFAVVTTCMGWIMGWGWHAENHP
jgi:hypothetical protein